MWGTFDIGIILVFFYEIFDIHFKCDTVVRPYFINIVGKIGFGFKDN